MAIGGEAKRLAGSVLFQSVLNALVADYMDELMRSSPASEAGQTAHAALRGLNDIKNRLKVLENDAYVATKEATGTTERPV